MKATGNILQRYYKPSKDESRWKGRAGAPPAMEKPSIAGETPALHRQSAILCKLVPSYFESRVCHIYTKQNLEWITG